MTSAWGLPSDALAQEAAEPPLATASAPALKMTPSLQAPLRGDAADRLPIIVQARELRGRPDLETEAEGDVEFRRGGLLLRADRLTYQHADDLAKATGHVHIASEGNVYDGSELQLHVQTFEGFFLEPTYFFGKTGAGGHADRLDFIDAERARLTKATYSSCQPDGNGSPAWILSTERVKLDFETNEGQAEGAVLRFYGVPILAAPVLSFPLTDARKSGWLPPSINLDSKSGLDLRVPYYWNIAPQRDATITPAIVTRRGVGGEAEFRYLEPSYAGRIDLTALPNDRVAGRSRYALDAGQSGNLQWGGVDYSARWLRVSDDNYWKDFPGGIESLTPRLLASNAQAHRTWTVHDGLAAGEWTAYTRLEQWQVLQDTDPGSQIVAPYERTPQIGVHYAGGLRGGFELAAETEYNRFSLPDGDLDPTRNTGSRLHWLGSISRPYVTPGWTLTPRVSLNAAAYDVDRPLSDGRRNASRAIPSFSLDSAWVLERDSAWFGQAMRQTLEPRLFYVDTPYREQKNLPDFDAYGRDFNFESIFAENAYSGIDRVSDAHQLTAGVTTRLLNAATGVEALRLGVMQRFLFRDQLIAPNPDGSPDGPALTQRVSDVLLLASTSLVPKWTFDTSLQYNPDIQRVVRSIVDARYSPGPFRTFNATYRFARDTNEQVELGWQWPIYRSEAKGSQLAASTTSSGSCAGTWYSVGRVNYSARDTRITDAIVGFEYDAGCWIGRVVAERLSTGRTEATTRLLLQLELVGLSRLGTNPLRVLKDNIVGYRLLREEPADPASTLFHP